MIPPMLPHVRAVAALLIVYLAVSTPGTAVWFTACRPSPLRCSHTQGAPTVHGLWLTKLWGLPFLSCYAGLHVSSVGSVMLQARRVLPNARITLACLATKDISTQPGLDCFLHCGASCLHGPSTLWPDCAWNLHGPERQSGDDFHESVAGTILA